MPDNDEKASEASPEDRFKKIRAELEAMKLPDLDEADLHSKVTSESPQSRLPDVPDLETVTSKAWEAKKRYEAKQKETSKRQNLEQASARSLGQGLTIAYAIVGLPIVGVGLGWLLDLLLKTVIFKGLGALVGLTCGVVVAIAQISRSGSSK